MRVSLFCLAYSVRFCFPYAAMPSVIILDTTARSCRCHWILHLCFASLRVSASRQSRIIPTCSACPQNDVFKIYIARLCRQPLGIVDDCVRACASSQALITPTCAVHMQSCQHRPPRRRSITLSRHSDIGICIQHAPSSTSNPASIYLNTTTGETQPSLTTSCTTHLKHTTNFQHGPDLDLGTLDTHRLHHVSSESTHSCAASVPLLRCCPQICQDTYKPLHLALRFNSLLPSSSYCPLAIQRSQDHRGSRPLSRTSLSYSSLIPIPSYSLLPPLTWLHIITVSQAGNCWVPGRSSLLVPFTSFTSSPLHIPPYLITSPDSPRHRSSTAITSRPPLIGAHV